MTPFEYFSVAISFIVGLGITRLLSSAVFVFRRRHRMSLSPGPLLWGAAIFFLHLQYWWTIFQLRELVSFWTPLLFANYVLLALLQFGAAALVLPSTADEAGDSLTEGFNRDGHWALPLLAAYAGLSFWTSWIFGLLSFLWSVLTISLGVLPLLGMAARSDRAPLRVALAYLILLVITGILVSPAGYQ